MTRQRRPDQHAYAVRNHWWWRPGWHLGRSGYTFHITDFTDQLHEHVAVYQRALTRLPGLDLIPHEWLHLTVQNIGFSDEVCDKDLDAIVAAAEHRLAEYGPVTLTFGRPVVGREAITIHPSGAESLVEVQAALRDAIASIRRKEHVEGDPVTFRPHVSIAYVNTDGPAEPFIEAVESTERNPTTVTVQAVSLITLNRDERMYRWREVRRIRLGTTL